MKTGTLKDVSCLAGYVTEDGQGFAVVVFVNHPGTEWAGEMIQSTVVDWALKQ
jgi:D-alanyl-D-alanine carboxypeptidase